jgi:hypothetical protein
MLTYQVRERTFRVQRDLEFPNDVELRFVFQPNTAFGNSGASDRTWKQSTPGSVIFNANTGHFRIEPTNELDELDITIEHSNMVFRLAANQLTLSSRCSSNRELTELLESVYYVFPLVLSLCLQEPVVVDRVDGRVGPEPIAWELKSWQVPILISNQEKQDQRVIEAWDLTAFLSSFGNMRVVGALKYFHAACRLSRVGQTPWEFMGEILLNVCKVLEVLFPPYGDGMSRQAARIGLSRLGYSSAEIERYFIPVMLLRNNIDVGHVFLGLFTRPELTALHSYTEVIERKWLDMLERVLQRVRADGTFLERYEVSSADREAKAIVSTIKQVLEQKPQP